MHGLTPAQRRWKTAGRYITKGAMVGQFFLAGLLTDHMIREKFGNSDPVLRAVSFLVFGYAAYSGKERLLTFYNSDTFASLADIDVKAAYRQGVAAPRAAAVKILNHLWAIVPSLGFAYLTKYAEIESAGFIRTYKGNDGDWKEWGPEILAQIVEYPALIAILASCSFVCNILGFPGIHQRGFSSFASMVQHVFARSESLEGPLSLEAAFVAGVNPLFTAFNQWMLASRRPLALPALTEGDSSSHDSGARTSTDTEKLLADSTDQSPEQLKAALFRILRRRIEQNAIVGASNEALLGYFEQKTDAQLRGLLTSGDPQPSVAWSKVSAVLGLGAATACAWGLSNFDSIGESMSADFFAITAEWGGAFSTTLNQVIGILFMLSMTLMSMGLGVDFERRFQHLAPTRRQVYPQILTPVESEVKTRAFAALMAILGGAPNIYQSLVMTHQALPTVVAAEYSSSGLEYGGFDALTRKEYEHEALERLIPQDIEVARLYCLFKRMHAIDPVHPSEATPVVTALVAHAPTTASCWAPCLRRDARGDAYLAVGAGGDVEAGTGVSQ